MNKRELAQKELIEVYDWGIEEEKRLVAKLKAEGRYEGGLDGNSKDFKYINEEVKRRIAALKEKYFPFKNEF